MFISRLGERAFRRPLAAQELDEYLALFNSAPELFPERDAFAAGAELTIAALLQAPALIYRVQDKRASDAEGQIARSDLELATQLSMMLWDSPPDDTLMSAAKAGALHTPPEIERQAKRLLDSPRAQDKLLDFYRQWLELRGYDALHGDTLAPAIGVTLHEEAERFIQAALLGESGSLAKLFTATFTFVNRDLARLYEVPGEFGDEWVRTELDGAQRAGFLTRIGFLISTAGQTAPIHRGVFVNRKLLCASLPPPPNFTPGKMMGDTRRQRIDSITGAGTCGAGCHATLINPAGYPLEYFDDLGRYRYQDNGHAIDGEGSYPFSEGSQSYADPIAFSRVLASSRQAHACYAKQLLEFALGRPSASGDAALLERLSDASREQQASVKDLVLLLTQGKSFRYRQAEEP